MLGVFDAADSYLLKLEGKKVPKSTLERNRKELKNQLGNLAVALITSMLTSLIMRRILKD